MEETIEEYRGSKRKKYHEYYRSEREKYRYERIIFEDESCGKIDTFVFYPEKKRKKRSPIVFDFHGGGMALGFPEQDFFIADRISHDCGCITVVIDYPLAPEYKYPKAIYVSCRCVRHFLKRDDVDEDRAFLMGHSAGSHLCCAMIQLFSKEGIHFRGFVSDYGIFEWSRQEKPSYDASKAISKSRMDQYFEWYFEDEEACNDGLVSPLMSDVSAYPDTLFNCAAFDSLLEEEKSFNKLLTVKGIKTEFYIYPSCRHGFTHPHLEEYSKHDADLAVQRIERFICERI